MRVNVYGEELQERTEPVKLSRPLESPAQGRVFFGVRAFLDSPDSLHRTETDDDSSAVTFWVPWTSATGHDFAKLRRILESMLGDLNELERGAR